ncbi:hypothetical protein Y033_5976 [Burkholderia pseudomallei MSHR435]|nr:hypothetical protein X941_5263 [Burkholderia pseudomallei MSHR5569]KGX53915.1 hypothetical protein Y024_5213 [Burkholderia pseudomallei TSV44]KGX79612.1 hypothetical protein Y033_5976 [Burkholderia pseudomallei MSHR435]
MMFLYLDWPRITVLQLELQMILRGGRLPAQMRRLALTCRCY